MIASRDVEIPLGDVTLEGILSAPENPIGLVIFAHGSGSSRFSKRNNFVAAVLHEQGMATLLSDLLTADEEVIDDSTRHLRFDITLLAHRLELTTRWIKTQDFARDLPIVYFGASTGAAAAIIAGAKLPDVVSAVISRGGRPDLAGSSLENIEAPVLLLVGGRDYDVIQLNQSAKESMRQSDVELVIIPGATHLFEEPGTLELVAKLASEWAREKLVGRESLPDKLYQGQKDTGLDRERFAP